MSNERTSHLLKEAAAGLEKLAAENNTLRQQNMAYERLVDAIKLAHEMPEEMRRGDSAYEYGVKLAASDEDFVVLRKALEMQVPRPKLASAEDFPDFSQVVDVDDTKRIPLGQGGAYLEAWLTQ